MDRHDRLVGSLATHEGRVFGYFRKMGIDRETSRDLAQETFVRAIRGARGYRGDAPIEAWLVGIARHVLFGWLRKHPEPPVADPGIIEPPGHDKIDVERALATLPAEEREVLVLRYSLDLPGSDVAEMLGISHDALRQRLVRARAAFREVWGDR